MNAISIDKVIPSITSYPERPQQKQNHRLEVGPVGLKRIEMLHKIYPISSKHLIQASFEWILALAIMTFFVGLTDYEKYLFNVDIRLFEALGDVELLFVLGIVMILATRLVIAAIDKADYHYMLKGGSLIIEKGILRKQRSSLPLSRIQSVHVGARWRDVLFGLSYLELLVPSAPQGFARIQGLDSKIAKRLQEHLNALIQKECVSPH
ncbi:MAG: PH domain-containing protein [SAR324 cluster bacterium]|uniref:PH domain-containing protein n=1 Tax=SAR324 cluster bacterium TaxID=2024889 RepID=A0A7X9FPL6_9DELT|nr:PH domain-containing protein [SAR324 cluster bacterium]